LYSSTYREYRESGFEKHHLKFKPIIKTDNKKILISNQYLLYNLLAEGLYWIIRNYFNSKGRQDFTNVFGLYYEKYLEDICTYYLDSDKFKKLVEDSKSQICDWKIETSKYILLVEQKSALASIFTKNIHPDIKQIKSYLKRLGKGFNQLKTSEDKIKNPDNKIIVKLLVHYESLYMPEILEDEIIKTLNKSADEYMNTFLATSSDIERIIYALSQGDDILNRIIDQKLYLEKIKDTNGRSFSKILDDNYIPNDYLKNVKNHYEKMVEKCRLLKTSF
ncbi:hypothetical protein, partial [Paraclostridium bifermentans]|uniref:hypothetical protein n=1 Tax=Paraclostridium bifermentans TaxID=1490 RepID=UPI0022E7174A